MLSADKHEILNNIIKDIYGIKNSAAMRQKLLKELKKIVDFKFGIFSLGAMKNRNVYLVDSITVSDFERSFEEEFLYLSETKYDRADYASWIFQIPESIVYRDSEIVDDELRKKTSYYKDYLLAYGLPNVAGISLVYEETFLGALTLYKNDKSGDFDEEDMFILRMLRPHLEKRLADDEETTVNNRKNVSYLLKSTYRMTSREVEIIRLVFHGKSNKEVAQELFITENTVKKHLNHIYEKVNVSNRSQLIQFLLNQEIGDVLV